jgi:hypothetical protein
MSDTQGRERSIPNIESGDVLVHTGNFSKNCSHEELLDFRKFLDEVAHPHKLVVAGNKDISLQLEYYKKFGSLWHESLFKDPGFDPGAYSEACRIVVTTPSFPFYLYLDDCTSTIEINDVICRVYGAPWQKFGKTSKEEMVAKWNKIPGNLDVLVTHIPPYGILDKLKCEKGSDGATVSHCGDEALLDAVRRAKPRIHVFGHAPSSYGKCTNARVNIFHVTWNALCLCQKSLLYVYQ